MEAGLILYALVGFVSFSERTRYRGCTYLQHRQGSAEVSRIQWIRLRLEFPSNHQQVMIHDVKLI